MKKIIGLIFILACFLFTSDVAFSQKVWTLKECIDYALKNNIQLKQNRLNIEVNQVKKEQVIAELFPTLNGNASHNYNYGHTIDPTTNSFIDKRTLTNNFSLNSSVPIFEGFQLQNTLRQSHYDLIASKYDVEKLENDVSLNVTTAYLQVLYNQELLTVSIDEKEASKSQAERTKKLYEAGSIPRGSLLDAEAQLANEELRVVSAQNALDISYLTLVQLLDMSSVKDFKVQDPNLPAPTENILDHSPDSVFSYAVKNQPDIKSSDYKVLSAKKGLAASRGTISPRLFLSASLGTGYSDNRFRTINPTIVQSTIPTAVTASGENVYGFFQEYGSEKISFKDQVDENLSKAIGLNLSVPLFNGWQTKSNIARSKINLLNAQLTAQQTKLQLSKTIQQAYADANASYKKYTANEKSLVALKEAFKYTEQKFSVGLVNSVDYVTAKNNLNKSESDLLQAKYDYIFKTKVLDFYLGKPLAF